MPSAIFVGGRVAEMYSHLAGDLDGDQRIQELPQSQREEPQWLESAGETPDPAVDRESIERLGIRSEKIEVVWADHPRV